MDLHTRQYYLSLWEFCCNVYHRAGHTDSCNHRLADRQGLGGPRPCVALKDENPQVRRPRHGIQGAPKAWRSWDHEVREELLSCTHSRPKQKVHFGLLKWLPGFIVSRCPGYWAVAGFGLFTSTQHLRTWPGSRTLFHFEISNSNICRDSFNSFKKFLTCKSLKHEK